MAGVNKVILVGRLGADPEIRHLPSGTTVANFNIATSESYTDKSGQKQEQTEWHRLELWDQQANLAEKYLKKGDQIYAEGKIKTESWQDKEGNSRQTTKIRVTNIAFLGGKGGNQESGGTYSQPSAETANKGTMANESFAASDITDDLPF